MTSRDDISLLAVTRTLWALWREKRQYVPYNTYLQCDNNQSIQNKAGRENHQHHKNITDHHNQILWPFFHTKLDLERLLSLNNECKLPKKDEVILCAKTYPGLGQGEGWTVVWFPSTRLVILVILLFGKWKTMLTLEPVLICAVRPQPDGLECGVEHVTCVIRSYTSTIRTNFTGVLVAPTLANTYNNRKLINIRTTSELTTKTRV